MLVYKKSQIDKIIVCKQKRSRYVMLYVVGKDGSVGPGIEFTGARPYEESFEIKLTLHEEKKNNSKNTSRFLMALNKAFGDYLPEEWFDQEFSYVPLSNFLEIAKVKEILRLKRVEA